ncbi:MAG: hypothetical protein EXR71_12395 [Myxococcales bacterium]|nr:hypothetical protein [Myxococcales bacterium]
MRLAPSALFASGCFVYTDAPTHPDDPPPQVAPVIDWADASCYRDEALHDDVWWFEADIFDKNGLDDVVAVYADVYDGYTGDWVDAFALDYDGGNTWYSAWPARSTWLDCDYYDYIVDFVAEDTLGEGDIYSLDLY